MITRTVLVVTLIVAAVALGACVRMLVERRGSPTGRTPTPMPRPAPDREETLVNGIIGAHDLTASAAVRAHLTEVLRRVGVAEIPVPTATRFDPRMHEAVATVVARSAADDRLVAEVVRPGWIRNDQVLRIPQVAVQVWDGGERR